MKRNDTAQAAKAALLGAGIFLLVSGHALCQQDFLAKKAVALGEKITDFELPDAQGKMHRLSDFQGQWVMIHFWSTKCPFVVRYEPRIQSLVTDYSAKDVVVLGIDSNVNEPIDEIKKVAAERGVNYTVLVDQGHKIADQFGAITTPHVYIVDQAGTLVYEGSVDDQGWNEEDPVTKNYAKDVLEALIEGRPVPYTQTKTFGCTIKRSL